MSDAIAQLEELSAEIQTRLALLTYEELGELMNDRQYIVDEIERQASRTPLSEDEKDRIRVVIEKDVLVATRINFLRNEAAHWLQQRNQAKVQRNAYDNAYTPDAYLMDSRK